jgi:dihydropteroate synthase
VDERPALIARDRVLPMGRKTYVMAIINLTDDSFSADGVGSDIDAAVGLAVQAESDGADIIDVGGESARADAPVRDAGEEAESVGAAIERIRRECGCVISVDTYKAAVAEAALQAGAHIVNDIGGMKEGHGTLDAAIRAGAALLINFTREPPKVRPKAPPAYGNLIGEHVEFLGESIKEAEARGLARERLIVDPGIAFGKSHDEDIEVLRRLREFSVLGMPLLVAASRKHFIGSVTGAPAAERDAGTHAVTALAVAGGADIVRVHDVAGNVQAARMADAVVRGNAGDFAATGATWPWAADAAPIAGTTIDPASR